MIRQGKANVIVKVKVNVHVTFIEAAERITAAPSWREGRISAGIRQQIGQEMGRQAAGTWQAVGRNSAVHFDALYDLKIWRFARDIRQNLQFFSGAILVLAECRPGGRRGAAKSAICSIGVIQI